MIMSDSVSWFTTPAFAEQFSIVAGGVLLVSSVALLLAKWFVRNAAARHVVLASALTSCLLLPGLTFLASILNVTLLSIPLHQDSLQVAQVPVAAETSTPPADKSESQRAENGASHDAFPFANLPTIAHRDKPEREERSDIASSPTDVRVVPIERSTQPAPNSTNLPVRPSLFQISVTVWFVGVLLMLVRLLTDCLIVARIRRGATKRDAESGLSNIAAELGLRPQPLVLTSSRIAVPMAVGFGRPAVILPTTLLESLNPSELRDILLHEVAHLARGDQRQVIWQRIAGALYWPIFTIHILNHDLQRTREELCDNLVLRDRDAVAYGCTLLKVAEFLVGNHRVSAAVGMMSRAGELEQRIAGLLDTSRNRETSASLRVKCVTGIVCLIVITILASTRMASTALAAGRTNADEKESTADQQAKPAESAGKSRKVADWLRQPYDRAEEFPKVDVQRHVRFSGRVTGPDGRGVAGAKLYISADSWTDPVEVGTTTADGIYKLTVLERDLRRYMDGSVRPDISATLIAIATGFGADWTTLSTINHEGWHELHSEYAQDFRLVVDQPITGRIQTLEGQPVIGASISISSIFAMTADRWQTVIEAWTSAAPGINDLREIDPASWQIPLFRTAWQMRDAVTTDSNGRFVLTGIGADRVATLRIAGPGIRSTKVSVATRPGLSQLTQSVREKFPHTPQPGGVHYPPRKDDPPQDDGVRLFDSTVTIEVDPARTIGGTVTDKSSGKPISNVRVVAGYMSEYTDRNGRYHMVRGEEQSTVWMFASPWENDRYLSVVQRLDSVDELAHISRDFSLVPGIVVSGQVVESGTDKPIASSPRSTCHAPWSGVMSAGMAYYYPLGTNTGLKGTPEGLYFEGGPARETNYYSTAMIGADGRFQIAVPPGPGVVMVIAASGAPMFFEMGVWYEKEGFHRLFPYQHLSGREKNDGAPAGDLDSFPGLSAPIPLTNMHAYRVISPAPGETKLDLTMTIPRAPTLNLHFVMPDGSPARDVMVKGLLKAEMPLVVVLAGSEAQAVALVPDQPRKLVAVTTDGKYVGHAMITAGDAQPKSIRLEPAALISGRLIDAANDKPLADFDVTLREPDTAASLRNGIHTDADGRFVLGSLSASKSVSLRIQEPRDLNKGFGTVGEAYQPDALTDLQLKPGQHRALGDVRVKLAKGKD